MKHFHFVTLLCFLLLIFSASPGLSKGWEREFVDVGGADLRAVSFADASKGMACGQKGVVIVTEDGGRDWRDVTDNLLEAVHDYIPIPVTIELYSIKFIDPENCWCAGKAVTATMDMQGSSFPVIFFTSDMGQSWTVQYPIFDILTDEVDSLARGDHHQINDLFFLDPVQGWAVGEGSRYLVTQDGGISWKPDFVGLITIPEIRMAINASGWLVPGKGMVAGFTYDMNSPERLIGFVASKNLSDIKDAWRMEQLPRGAYTPPLNDIFLNREGDDGFYAVAVGNSGTILRRDATGEWSSFHFPWPLAFTLPEFRGVSFSSGEDGFTAGYFRRGITVDPDDSPPVATIFRTRDSGRNWQPEAVGIQGILNDVDAVETSSGGDASGQTLDAWAVGNDSLIVHYHNSPPKICSLSADPEMVFAGGKFVLEARVDDFDNPFEDIVSVTANAMSVGAGIVELKPAYDDTRRCILYTATIETSPLSTYGVHELSVTVTDRDNASDSSRISIFVVTSYVEIGDTWAVPDPVLAGNSVALYAKVRLVAPKLVQEEPPCYNRIERVMVNISDLIGVDCELGTDCDMWVPMEYDPAIDAYAVKVRALVPGFHRLPVFAEDTLGHRDKALINLVVYDIYPFRFDFDSDGDVDGIDLARMSISECIEVTGCVERFARQFGMVIVPQPVLDISE